MFSSRFPSNQATNRVIKALKGKRTTGIEVFDLTESNPTRAGFVYEERTILESLAKPECLLYQPDPQGLLCARQAVAEYYQSLGKMVEPDSLLLTASTSEAYGYLFKLLANPDNEIFVPEPGYPLLDFLTGMESINLIHYPLEYNPSHGWQINMEKLRYSISTKTVAIVVVSPNNPTGSFLKKYELNALNEICAEYNLALIIDEVFSDYCEQRPENQVQTAVENRDVLTFVLNGFSKILGLPQVKLGWIHINGPKLLCSSAQARLEFIADTYLSVSTMIQHAAVPLFKTKEKIQSQIMDRLKENECFLKEKFSQIPSCQILMREGGWYAVIEIHDIISDEERCCQFLSEENVFVHPGFFYDFPQDGFLVISLLTPVSAFREGISRIARRLS